MTTVCTEEFLLKQLGRVSDAAAWVSVECFLFNDTVSCVDCTASVVDE